MLLYIIYLPVGMFICSLHIIYQFCVSVKFSYINYSDRGYARHGEKDFFPKRTASKRVRVPLNVPSAEQAYPKSRKQPDIFTCTMRAIFELRFYTNVLSSSRHPRQRRSICCSGQNRILPQLKMQKNRLRKNCGADSAAFSVKFN